MAALNTYLYLAKQRVLFHIGLPIAEKVYHRIGGQYQYYQPTT